jgi:transposase InsO family protein
VSEKFEFIDAERAAADEAPELLTVSRMCALSEVSKSGRHGWRYRRVGATSQRPDYSEPRPFRATTEPDPNALNNVDLFRRDSARLNRGPKSVGDITYIRTWQGRLYLAVLNDCATREEIGYAMAEHMRTRLVLDAVDMAMRNERL